MAFLFSSHCIGNNVISIFHRIGIDFIADFVNPKISFILRL
jgi:hypothetical protein